MGSYFSLALSISTPAQPHKTLIINSIWEIAGCGQRIEGDHCNEIL